jgi:pyruvate,water dikinase
MHIIWLNDPASRRVEFVGGKIALLSRLAASCEVPPGFCLTTLAHELATLDSKSDGARAPHIPDWMFQDLAAAYWSLASKVGSDQPTMAVRSSAVDEDEFDASFSRHHETFLNVHGLQEVISAIHRCWASATSPRALAMRRQQGLAADWVRLAVLVQQFVKADVSAVVSSVNPLTNADEMLINANWGLDESVVAGMVTPDTYIIRKSDLSLQARQIADKRRMTVRVRAGTCEVDLPPCLQRKSSLTDAQIAEIGALTKNVEQTLGVPVDVVCAYCSGKLYLLQCRRTRNARAVNVAMCHEEQYARFIPQLLSGHSPF